MRVGGESYPADAMPPSSPDLQARRSRVKRIRRRVVGAAIALFALGTGAITLQLVTGHDPALAKATAEAAATSGDRSAPSTSTSSPGGGYGPPAGAGGSGGGRERRHGDGGYGGRGSPGSSSGLVAPLTTGQS